MFETTILAILQGIAEFLPISSSGHLVLGKEPLGVKTAGIRLDIFLHVGTLASIGVFYWKVIRRIVSGRNWGYLAKIVISAIPVCTIGYFFEEELEDMFASPHAVGAALLFTGIVLFATKILPKGDRKVSYVGAIAMGLAQTVAVLPGVSRSGMTIAAAKASKVGSAEAAEFSFLMSIIPIFGAGVLQVVRSMRGYCPNCPSVETEWPLVIYGGILAAVVGYLSLAVLLKTLKSDKFWLFGPYCLLAGGATLILI